MKPFEKIIAYAEKFDPDFPDTIEGALPYQIDQLQSLLKAPIPKTYKNFLQTMGRNTDWIKIQELDFNIETVLEYYKEENWLPADRFIRIGTDQHVVELNPYLELEILDEPTIVRYPPFEQEEFEGISILKKDPLAGSLEELFAMPIFKMFELRVDGRTPICLLTEKWDFEAMKNVERVAKSLGFKKLWFSSDTGHAYNRDDATAIHANQWVGYPLQIFISSKTENDAEFVANELLKKLAPIKRVS